MNERKPLGTFVLGTRPVTIKLALVIRAFQAAPDFPSRVVLIGQYREIVSELTTLYGIKSDHGFAPMAPKQTLTHITFTFTLLNGLRQELEANMLAQGHISKTFAPVLAAFNKRIPVGHIESELRIDGVFDPFTEEPNFRMIFERAQLNFAPIKLKAANCRASKVVGGMVDTSNTVIDSLLQRAQQLLLHVLPWPGWSRNRMILTAVRFREIWRDDLDAIGKGFRGILEYFPNTDLPFPLNRNAMVCKTLQPLWGCHVFGLLNQLLDYDQLAIVMVRLHPFAQRSWASAGRGSYPGHTNLIFV